MRWPVSHLDLTLAKLVSLTTGEGFPPRFKAGKKPTNAQIATIRHTLEDAKNTLLKKARSDEIMNQFLLLSGGMRLPRDLDGESAAKSYMIALSGFSSFAIMQSVLLIIRGKAEGFNKTFMPTAPELAAFCEHIEKTEWLKIDTVERLLRAGEEEQNDVLIPEAREEKPACDHKTTTASENKATEDKNRAASFPPAKQMRVQ
ncbi:hypothetical protein H3U94_10380 [Bartonella sp. W8125]|uniref:hypothetical protein n=1 Tax=Bartonella TaxID=773 RepID=UPI0018DC80C3|nr:hypothetical protein [Bartonella choladocola]MBI0141275.1 hypothetical protein [Bartonella choladocola]